MEPVDADGDGFAADVDCDDNNPLIHPNASDLWYDGVDQDCAGNSDFDADGDGFDAFDYGGEDCDDTNSSIYLGAPEIPEDHIDQDCDGIDPLADLEHTASLVHADFQLNGMLVSSSSDSMGRAVADAGDVDGDGMDDFLVGSGYVMLVRVRRA
jgi:hypothetical protein